MPDSFSQRHGWAGPPRGTLLRDEVPPSFRMFLTDVVLKGPHLVELDEVQVLISRILRVFPHPSGTPSFHCRKHIKECEWFFIYDIIEGLYKRVYENETIRYLESGSLSVFNENVNKALIEENIGWQLVRGKIITRGDEAFEGAVKTAITALKEHAKPTSAGHMQSAIIALSVRPLPNTSGAVAHATSAVECVLGEITGQAMTLEKYLDKHSAVFHPALKKGLDGIYGYASDQGARHGKEGTEPALEEAAFVVATCAAICTLLIRKPSK
jgi:hypothetical protein